MGSSSFERKDPWGDGSRLGRRFRVPWVDGCNTKLRELCLYPNRMSRTHLWLQRVSLSYWLLSQIEMSLRLPCTSSINITPFSSHFSTLGRNILSEHVHHNCQRPIRSVPAPVAHIHSLFNSVSNLPTPPFFFFFKSFIFLLKPFIFIRFYAPFTLSKLVSLRFCHYV